MKKFITLFLLFFALTLTVYAATYKVTSGGTVKSSNGNVQRHTVQQVNTYRANSIAQNANPVTQNANIDITELVIDYSGSMYSWIVETKAALNSILRGLTGTSNLGVRVFGNDMPKETIVSSIIKDSKGKYKVTTKQNEATKNSCNMTKQIVTIGNHSSNEIITSLDSIRLGGSTPLTLGLQQTVMQDFAKYGINLRKKIILLTDGGENCGGDPCAYINALTSHRNDIVIDVIYTGNGRSNLACLSNATGGRFYNVRDAYQFQNILYNSVSNTSSNNAAPANNQNGNSNLQGFEFIE